MSPCEDPAESLTAILNDPAQQQQDEGTCHMVRVFKNIPGQLKAFKSRHWGVDPGPSGMAPVPPAIIGGRTCPRVSSAQKGEPFHIKTNLGKNLRGELLHSETTHYWRWPSSKEFRPTRSYHTLVLGTSCRSLLRRSSCVPPCQNIQLLLSPLWPSKGPSCCCLW